MRLKDGDRLIGQTGETVTRGPATYGVPKVNIRPSGSPDKIIAPLGKDIEIKWVDIAGAVGRISNGNPQNGTGAGIAGPSAAGGYLVQYAVIHGNDAAGILNVKGRILNSEFYDNTQNPAFLGFNGSAVKGITEYEAAYNYVHDEQGNGLWCDVGCKNDPAGGPTASGSTTTSPWTTPARGSVTSQARGILQQASMPLSRTRSSNTTRYTATPTVRTGGASAPPTPKTP